MKNLKLIVLITSCAVLNEINIKANENSVFDQIKIIHITNSLPVQIQKIHEIQELISKQSCRSSEFLKNTAAKYSAEMICCGIAAEYEAGTVPLNPFLTKQSRINCNILMSEMYKKLGEMQHTPTVYLKNFVEKDLITNFNNLYTQCHKNAQAPSTYTEIFYEEKQKDSSEDSQN